MAPDEKTLQLAEVWGETVAPRNLTLALVISCPTTLVAFLVAKWLFESNMANQERASTYSLLVGLFVIVVCAVVCARLFRPQRIVTTDASAIADSSTFEDALKELADDEGGLGSVERLPAEVAHEMRELGLYDAFAHAETASTDQPSGIEKGLVK
jgi:hypothetical protein